MKTPAREPLKIRHSLAEIVMRRVNNKGITGRRISEDFFHRPEQTGRRKIMSDGRSLLKKINP
jgi:hypothetical protein